MIIEASACCTTFGNTSKALYDSLVTGKSDGGMINGLQAREDRSFSLLEVAFNSLCDNIDLAAYQQPENPLYISSSKGSQEAFYRTGEWSPVVSPSDRAGIFIKRKFGFCGPVVCLTAACATGIFALDSAIRYLIVENCDRTVVAATESALNPAVLAGFRNMGVMAKGAPKLCGVRRDGFIPGEGAAALAVKKSNSIDNEQIYVAATACSTAIDHPVSMNENGVAIAGCIVKCLRKAGLSPRDIGAVCLHGTATANNDLAEARAIKAAFGGYNVPCFGVKPNLGHLLGSSAIVEMVISMEVLNRMIIPPTLLNGERDPLCDIYLSSDAMSLKVPRVLSLNYGFGGHVAAVILCRKA